MSKKSISEVVVGCLQDDILLKFCPLDCSWKMFYFKWKDKRYDSLSGIRKYPSMVELMYRCIYKNCVFQPFTLMYPEWIRSMSWQCKAVQAPSFKLRFLIAGRKSKLRDQVQQGHTYWRLSGQPRVNLPKLDISFLRHFFKECVLISQSFVVYMEKKLEHPNVYKSILKITVLLEFHVRKKKSKINKALYCVFHEESGINAQIFVPGRFVLCTVRTWALALLLGSVWLGPIFWLSASATKFAPG